MEQKKSNEKSSSLRTRKLTVALHREICCGNTRSKNRWILGASIITPSQAAHSFEALVPGLTVQPPGVQTRALRVCPVVIGEIKNHVTTVLLGLRESLRRGADTINVARAKEVLAKHVGKLLLTPVVRDGHPVYKVSGNFTIPNSDGC
jgi:hypothetical protein